MAAGPLCFFFPYFLLLVIYAVRRIQRIAQDLQQALRQIEHKALSDKYAAADKQIRLGNSTDAAYGLARLLGVSDKDIASYLDQHEVAIQREFDTHGDKMDQANLAEILAGTYTDTAGEMKSLDDLMLHQHVQMAKLERHHVLALRLYTTES